MGEHPQLGSEVADLAAVVAGLRARGTVFEDVDVPGLRTVHGIAEGGRGEFAVWFVRDSEGNLLGIGQPR